jgi:hypothetical protein
MKKRFGMAIALLALMGLAASVELQDRQSGAKEPSLEELAARLLETTYLDGELKEVQLLPGELPQELPVDLPLPEGTRIVGSKIQEDMGIDIVLDVPLTPDEAIEFYRQALAPQNWTETNLWDGGFKPADPSLTFCGGRKKASILLSAHPKDNGSDLRLSFITDIDSSPCSWAGSFVDWMKPIPRLPCPPGAKQSSENSMGGGSNVAVSAVLETEMNSSTIADYYADLLQSANWTMKGEVQSRPSSWSTWSIQDDEGVLWEGILMAVELPGNESQRFVLVQASMEDC